MGMAYHREAQFKRPAHTTANDDDEEPGVSRVGLVALYERGPGVPSSAGFYRRYNVDQALRNTIEDGFADIRFERA